MVHAGGKFLPLRLRAGAAGIERKLPQVGGMKAQVLQAGQGLAPGGRAGRQMRGMGLDFVGTKVEGRELCQPLRAIAGELRVRRAAGAQHLVPFEHHMVLGGAQRNAGVGQAAAHLVVARNRGGFVVVVGEHGLHVQRLRQFGQQGARGAVQHDQAVCRLSGGA